LIRFYEELGLLMPIVADGLPEEILARTLAELEKRRSWSHQKAS
jgi:hypothetical protein